MSSSSRRDFLKKNFLGGVIGATGIPLLAAGNSLNRSELSANLLARLANDDWDTIRSQFLITDRKTYLNTSSLVHRVGKPSGFARLGFNHAVIAQLLQLRGAVGGHGHPIFARINFFGSSDFQRLPFLLIWPFQGLN